MVDPFASQAADNTKTQQNAVKNTNGLTSFSADDVFGGNPDVFADMGPSAFQPIDPVTGQVIDHTKETLDPFLRDGEALAAPSSSSDVSVDTSVLDAVEETQDVLPDNTSKDEPLDAETVDSPGENIVDLDSQSLPQDTASADDSDPFLRTDSTFQEPETSDYYDPFVSDIDQQVASGDNTIDPKDVSSPMATDDDVRENDKELQETVSMDLGSDSLPTDNEDTPSVVSDEIIDPLLRDDADSIADDSSSDTTTPIPSSVLDTQGSVPVSETEKTELDVPLDSSSDTLDPQAISDMENILQDDFDADAAKQAMMDIQEASVSPDLPTDTVDTKEDTQGPSMVQGLVDSFVDPFLETKTPSEASEEETPLDGTDTLDAPIAEDTQEVSDTDIDSSSLSGTPVLDQEEEQEEDDKEPVVIDPVTSSEQTVDESVNDAKKVDGQSDLVEKFSSLQKAIYHVYDYQEKEGEFSIVGSDNDMLHVSYVFALSTDEQEIIVSKEQTDRKTDHTDNHVMRFVLTASSELEVFVDDVLLFSEPALLDDVKSKMQLLDKFNKFIFLVNTYADSLAESHRIAQDAAIAQETKDTFQQF